jgi:hypothetical protein
MSTMIRKLAATLAVAGLALSAGAATASAGSTPLGQTAVIVTPESWDTCTDPTIVNPFAAFSDTRDYVLAPQGSFENALAPGWQFSPGVRISEGADGFNLGGAADRSSLTLPEGGTALSPAMCVDLNYLTFRFAHNALTDPDQAEISIEVVYPNTSRPEFKEMKHFDGRQGTHREGDWLLSDDVDLQPDRGGSRWGGRLTLIKFKALSGSWRIDDVFVDPRMR